MTKAFALKISMKALFFFVVSLQYNKNRGRLTDLLDSLTLVKESFFSRSQERYIVDACNRCLQLVTL